MALPELDTTRLPRHIAIIMDGNGRWARQHGLARAQGHEEGARSARAVIEACHQLGVGCLSLYAFSTENWRRSRVEIATLFRLLSKYIHLELDSLHKENVRVTVMGRLEGLPARAQADLQHCMDLTRDNSAMVVNVAINYGARREIADAAQAIARAVRDGILDPEDVDEACVQRHLYAPDLPDPDMLIRTSGELRLSNFMLWQLSYAEIVATPTLWPDFRKEHLHHAIAEYQARERRFGGR
jgi:undecaprenyl diphosphate synthase